MVLHATEVSGGLGQEESIVKDELVVMIAFVNKLLVDVSQVEKTEGSIITSNSVTTGCCINSKFTVKVAPVFTMGVERLSQTETLPVEMYVLLQLKWKVIWNEYIPGVLGVLMVLHAVEVSGGLGQAASIVRDELVKVTYES
jgi:hypothetical protein